MNQYLFDLKMNGLEKRLDGMQGILTQIESRINLEDDLWDNADMAKNFKVSPRTLAEWRNKGLIGYSKIGGKIYYTPLDRQTFLESFHINHISNEL